MKTPVLLAMAIFCIVFACKKTPFTPGSDQEQGNVEPPATRVKHVKALVVYAQDADDDYPFPSVAFRNRLYKRIQEYYKVMSYGQHELEFVELNNNNGYFRAGEVANYYRRQFHSGQNDGMKYDGPFAIFNQEILQQVISRFGEEVFTKADLIYLIGTDGGPGWYLPGANAEGFARLGFKFQAGGRTFDADFGGITIEIGSDYTHELYEEAVIYWLFAHEYAHWLGFRKHRSNNIGIYSLMTQKLNADAEFLNNVRGPNPLDPFLLMRFGWLDKSDNTRVQLIEAAQSEVRVELAQIRSRTGVILAQIRIPGTEMSPEQQGKTYENFYVAYHRPDISVFDGAYSGYGLLIWHTVYDNILDIECGLSFAEVASLDHLDIGNDMQGLPSDFYNSENGLEFTPQSRPNTNIWGVHNSLLRDLPSGVAITDIQEVNGKISFTVSFDTTLAGQNQKQLERNQSRFDEYLRPLTSSDSNERRIPYCRM